MDHIWPSRPSHNNGSADEPIKKFGVQRPESTRNRFASGMELVHWTLPCRNLNHSDDLGSSADGKQWLSDAIQFDYYKYSLMETVVMRLVMKLELRRRSRGGAA
jgi:hypothetical protein